MPYKSYIIKSVKNIRFYKHHVFMIMVYQPLAAAGRGVSTMAR